MQTTLRLAAALALLSPMGLIGCTADTSPDDFDGLTEPLSFQECDRADFDRGDVCIDGFRSTGDRCSSDRQCEPGTVCGATSRDVGGDPHCYYIERDRDDRAECPRGSFPRSTQILCAEGFEDTLVTRDGCHACRAVRDDCDAVARCENARMTIDECFLAVAGRDARDIQQRCANAGYRLDACLNLLVCGHDDGADTRPEPEPVRPDETRPDEDPSRPDEDPARPDEDPARPEPVPAR